MRKHTKAKVSKQHAMQRRMQRGAGDGMSHRHRIPPDPLGEKKNPRGPRLQPQVVGVLPKPTKNLCLLWSYSELCHFRTDQP